MEVKNTLVNKITNIVGVIVAVSGVVATALETVPADAQWYTIAIAVVVAVVMYFFGKGKKVD